MSEAISGALKQVLRSQILSPAGSQRSSVDGHRHTMEAFPPRLTEPSIPSNLASQDHAADHTARPQSQAPYIQSALFAPTRPLPSISESSPPSSVPTAVLAPHDAAAAARLSLLTSLARYGGGSNSGTPCAGRHSVDSLPPIAGRPPPSPRAGRKSTGGIGVNPSSIVGPPLSLRVDIANPRHSCARARAKAQQPQQALLSGQAQAPVSFPLLAGTYPAQPRISGGFLKPASPTAAPRVSASLAADAEAKASRQAGEGSACRETASVLAAVAAQLATQGGSEKSNRKLAKDGSPDLELLCHSLRPLKIPQEDPRAAANVREVSLRHGLAELASSASQPLDVQQQQIAAGKAGAGRTFGAEAAQASGAKGSPESEKPAPGAAGRQSAARSLFNVTQAAASSRATVRSLAGGADATSAPSELSTDGAALAGQVNAGCLQLSLQHAVGSVPMSSVPARVALHSSFSDGMLGWPGKSSAEVGSVVPHVAGLHIKTDPLPQR